MNSVFMESALDREEYLFFSILVPAHNEEKYISKTLGYLKGLDYPKDKYEVIIVENGSTDNTLSILEQHKNIENVFIFSSKERGVSRAKNLGISKISVKSDWTIFLDADTILKKGFLKNLNSYLREKSNMNIVIGTTSVLPDSNSKYAHLWFSFYNFAHWLIKVSFSIQIARTSVASKIRFDEHLSYGEDYKFVRDSQKFGKFFFFRTDEVLTSTRRFEEEGWFKLFFKWIVRGMLPEKIRRRVSYEVIR
ncbi:MAG: glycosyltransferase family 2 protein [Caldisericaceae bacterium]